MGIVYNRMEIYHVALEGYSGWGIIIVWKYSCSIRGLWRVGYHKRMEIYHVALEGYGWCCM